MIVTEAAVAALQVGYKDNYQTAYTATRAETAFMRIATVIPSNSKSQTYGWLGKFPKMREWIGPREFKNMQSTSYTLENKDFEGTVTVDRNDIEDDNLGHLSPLFQEMGMSAAQHPDELTFNLLANGRTELCFDGQPFFDADHPSFDKDGNQITVSNVDASGGVNDPWWYLLDVSRPLKPLIYQDRKKPEFVMKTTPTVSDHVFINKEFIYGVDCRCNVGFGFWQMAYASNAPLNSDNLDAAIQAMRMRFDSNGQPLGIKPGLLVVGPTLRGAANKTVKVMFGDGGASNPNYNAVDVLDTDWVAAA